jgi:hypothetical protein
MRKLFLVPLALTLLAAAGALQPATASPLQKIEPAIASPREEVRSVCHHYRWSSQRRCTSAQTLRFVARPPLYYPYRYYGGTPHYRYARPNYYWRTYPHYAHHRWHRAPFGYGWY